MWQGFITLLAEAAKPSENGFEKWQQLLPLLVLVAFSVLSSILKGKQKKKSGQPTPKQEPDQSQGRAIPRPLPSYARRAQQSQPGQQGQQMGQKGTGGRSATTSQTCTYRPADKSSYGSKGTSAPGTDRSLRSPGKLKPLPSQTARQPVSPAATSSYRSTGAPPPLPTIKRSGRARAVKTQSDVTSSRQVSYGKSEKQEARSLMRQFISENAPHKVQTQGSREAAEVSSASDSATGSYALNAEGGKRLHVSLQNRNDVVQAIVLAEILGMPAGLKDKGSYDF